MRVGEGKGGRGRIKALIEAGIDAKINCMRHDLCPFTATLNEPRPPIGRGQTRCEHLCALFVGRTP